MVAKVAKVQGGPQGWLKWRNYDFEVKWNTLLCSVYQIQKEGEPIFAVDEESLLRTDHTISYCNSVFHNVSSMWQRAAGYYVRLISTFVSDTHSVSLTPPPTLSISPPSSFLSIATFELIKNWIRAA